jgi:hypothetical protein
MNRLAVLPLLLCLSAIPSASAQPGKTDIQALLSKERNAQCVLANSQNVICYASSTREIYQLQAGKNGVSSRLLISLPAGTPTPSMKMPTDAYLWELSAQEDGRGNIVIAWRYSRDFVDTINVLYAGPDGRAQHSVVKEFKQQKSFFDLKTFVVNPRFIQFFYTYYSEQYFSPILDVGSIQKLWTLGWRDGKTVFDVQLSEKGTVHTTRYDASYRGEGKFDLAWQEERIGSFFGPRRKFKVGTVSSDQDTPQLTESGEIPIDRLEPQDKVIFPIVGQSDNQDFKALASISYGKDGIIYKKLGSNGKVLGERRVEGDVVSEFGYDLGTPRLFRYAKGRLTGFLQPPASIKAELHWTDFGDRDWVEQLEVPVGSIFPSQRVANCFFWLQPSRENFELHRKCRQGG